MKRCMGFWVWMVVWWFGVMVLPAQQGAPPPAAPAGGDVHGLAAIPTLPPGHRQSLPLVVANHLTFLRQEADTTRQLFNDARQKLALHYLQMGEYLHAIGFGEGALAAYRNAIGLRPERTEWFYNLGMLLQSGGRYAEAVHAYQQSRTGTVDAFLLAYRIGECFMALDQWEQAQQAFDIALDLKPQNPTALIRLGEAALARGNHEHAVTVLREALEQQPNANKLHGLLAQAYEGLPRPVEAEHHQSLAGDTDMEPFDPLKERLGKLASGTWLWEQKGQEAFSRGDFTDAGDAFQKALDADNANAGAHLNLGATLAQLQHFEAAETHLREALRLDPGNAIGHYNLGRLLMRKQAHTEAVAHFQYALTRHPDDPMLMSNLATALQGAGQYEEALATYTRSLEIDSAQVSVWIQKSILHMNLQQPAKALAILEKAHTLLPQEADITHALARFLAMAPDTSLRDGKRALVLARKAYRADANFHFADTLAMAHAEAGLCDQAAEWQRKAIAHAAEVAVDTATRNMLERHLRYYAENRTCRVPASSERWGRDDTEMP